MRVNDQRHNKHLQLSKPQNKLEETMAAISHVRSNSFPSRPHPQAVHVDEQLARLRSSEAASSSSTSSICKRIDNLQDLHESLDKLLRLPALAQEHNKKYVEQLLDGSLRILELCNVSKDALSEMKESLMEIQSILRRKRGDLSGEVKKYLALRKSIKKSFQKQQKTLKVAQENKDESLAVFGEAEAVTVSLFDSLFSFISGSSKTCGKWSMVSKLVSHKKVTSEAESNEFTKIDFEFQSEKSLKMEDVQILEPSIQDLEDGIESLSKQLIKYRVSMLNTL